ncbi:MAG: AAA family ATPase [Verrucomicrobiota bacterium]
MSFVDELEILIRARYPVIYLHTSEETRILPLVAAVATRRNKRVFEWSSSTGLVPGGTHPQSQKARNPATRDPLVALDQVIEQVEPAIFVFKDLHPYLCKSGPSDNAVPIRKLREVALHLKNSFKTILLVSPVLEIPVELEKEITVLDFPLPGREDLSELLDRIVADLRELKQVSIELEDAGRDRLIQAALGLTWSEAENVFAKIIVTDGRLTADDVHAVFAEKQQIIRKNGLLEYHPPVETFDAVGGLAVLKEWLRMRADAFTMEARAFGLSAPRGVLLLGVQGCGKSLCAKAVASAWQMPLLRFDLGRMFSSLVGSSEENVRKAIAAAESVAPAVLWVDEIDKAFSGAQGGGASDGGTSGRVFGTFLTWLSEKTAPVFVVATANEIAHLPAELLRKGRLDEIFFVDLPTEFERREIFRVHLLRRGREAGRFDLAALAAASEGFSGAEIEEAVNSALYEAFHVREDLSMRTLQAALSQTVPLARTLDEPIRRLRTWAEGRARNASALSEAAPSEAEAGTPSGSP